MNDKFDMGLIIAAGAVIALYLAFRIVKRYLRSRITSGTEEGPSFSVMELQKMYDKGLISKEEFKRLRKEVINDMMK